MASQRSKYLWTPVSDYFWIILCPLITLAAMHAVWRWGGLSDTEVYAVLFAFVVTGHHMPGWLRAFGEPAIYQEHKAKLWVSFLAVPLMIILPTYYGLGFAALVIAATFDLWHVAMQQHGFGRIYAAKDGDVAPRSARIDLACVLVWYATVVFCSDSWTYGIAASFRSAGLPIFSIMSPESWGLVKLSFLATSGLLLLLYLHQALRLWRSERRFTTRKHVLHLTAFGVLAISYQDPNWYRAQSVQNLFHAMQYFFIVWTFSHLSLQKQQSSPKVFYRALFKFRWGLLIYLGLIALYGWGGWSLEAYSDRFPGGPQRKRLVQVLGSIGLASLLLHYYVDSFIWKVRTRHVRQALGIEGQGERAQTSRHLRGAVHAVAYFGVPLALMLWVGVTRDRSVSIETLRHETRLYPRSAQARFFYGVKAMNQQDWQVARAELSAALALAPTKHGPALLLAEIDAMQGRHALELTHIRAMLRAAPNDGLVRLKLAWALVARGQLAEATRQMERSLAQRRRSTAALLELGRLHQFHLGQPRRAIPLLQEALRGDPENSDAICELTRARMTLGQIEIARVELRAYLKRNPTDGNAKDLFDQIDD